MDNLRCADILVVMEVVSMSMLKTIIVVVGFTPFIGGIDTSADMEHGVQVLLAFR